MVVKQISTKLCTNKWENMWLIEENTQATQHVLLYDRDLQRHHLADEVICNWYG